MVESTWITAARPFGDTPTSSDFTTVGTFRRPCAIRVSAASSAAPSFDDAEATT
jgi:hypothetical protein